MYTLLIADDEPLERDTLELFIKRSKLPIVCVKVKNGREAVRAVLHPRENEQIDIAFLDIQMPLLNGLDAALEIHVAKPELPIVFLTAWGVFDFAQQAIRVGAEDYLVKPVQKETVITVLEKIVQRLKIDENPKNGLTPGIILKGGGVLRDLRDSLTSLILEGNTEDAHKTAIRVIDECKKEAEGAHILREFLIVLMHIVESNLISIDFPSPQPGTLAETASYLKSFVVCACDIALTERKNKYAVFFTETCKYIDTHYSHNFELEPLARQININPYYFSKLFKEHTGVHFIEYVRSVRLEAARKLLEQNETVAETGKRVGYTDTAYFSRLFKEEFGMGPREFKEQTRRGK